MSSTDEFAEGAHALGHRRHKQLHLRAAGGYPVYGGIGAYGSPLGVVTGVQTGQDNDHDADDQPAPPLSSDQFGGSAPAGAGDSGGTGDSGGGSASGGGTA